LINIIFWMGLRTLRC